MKDISRLNIDRLKKVCTPWSPVPQLFNDFSLLSVPGLHPPVDFFVTPAFNVWWWVVTRLLLKIARPTMINASIFSQEANIFVVAFGVWAFVPQRRIREVF